MTDDQTMVLVCGSCFRAVCWHGEMMCDDAKGAGLITLTVGELKVMDQEHPDNWSDEKMIEIYGNADRTFGKII